MNGASGVVHVWRATLDGEPSRLSRMAASLDQEELARATRFRFERDRSRFVTAHGVLRAILARYVNQPPEAIRVGRSRHGKPFLAEHPQLHFNLSHAAGLLLVAISRCRRIGVDVERIPGDDVIDAAGGVAFSAPELDLLRRARPDQRRQLFGKLWTRKEAYIKADGRGMSLPLERIDVGTAPDDVLVLGPGQAEWSPAPGWRVRSVAVPRGSAGAIVTEGADCRVACFDWPDDA